MRTEPQYKTAVCICSARSRGSASHSSSQSHKAAEEILLLRCEPQALGTSCRATVLSVHLLHYHEHRPGCVVLQNKKSGHFLGRVPRSRAASTCIEPSKKLEGDKSLFGAVEQYHCIHHLLRGNLWVWSGEDEGVWSVISRGMYF